MRKKIFLNLKIKKKRIPKESKSYFKKKKKSRTSSQTQAILVLVFWLFHVPETRMSTQNSVSKAVGWWFNCQSVNLILWSKRDFYHQNLREQKPLENNVEFKCYFKILCTQKNTHLGVARLASLLVLDLPKLMNIKPLQGPPVMGSPPPPRPGRDATQCSSGQWRSNIVDLCPCSSFSLMDKRENPDAVLKASGSVNI